MKLLKKSLVAIMTVVMLVAPISSAMAPIETYAATTEASKIDAGEIKKPKISNNKKETKKNSVTIKIGKTKSAAGYEIQYSTKKNFKDAKKTSAKYDATSKTIKNLKKNTTYYVRVRAYKKVTVVVDGKKQTIKIYTGWTTVKVKTSKK